MTSLSKIIPAVSQAAIQAIADPQARAVVRAIADGLAVRNGDKGNGEHAFLTVGDLKEDKSKAAAVADAVAVQLGTGVAKPGTAMFDLADKLIDRILASPEWLALFTRIGLIDAPDTTPGSLANSLLVEARERGAAVTEVKGIIQTEKESVAQKVTTITAALGQNAAAIKTEELARVTAVAAEAARITTMAAEVGKNAAAIQEESRVRADAMSAEASRVNSMVSSTNTNVAGLQTAMTTRTNSDNALASAVNTLWAKVGNNTALVQSGTQIVANNVGTAATKFDQLQATVTDPVTGNLISSAALRTEFNVTNNVVEGMKGNWSLKLDLNGFVSGMSLNASKDTAGNTRSNILFNVDTFAVGAPGRPSAVPFAIDANTGLVSIKGDLVADGSITSRHMGAYSVDRSKLAFKAVGGAQIDDLAVDTLKIAGNSVMVGVYDESGSNYVGAGSSVNLMTRTIDLGDSYNSGVIVSGVVALHAMANATYGVRVIINGQTAGDLRGSLQGGYPILTPCSGYAKVYGRYATVTLQAYNPTSAPGSNVALVIGAAHMSIMGGKR